MYIDGQQVEQVSQFREFRYLINLISEDGYWTKDIQSRIEILKKVLMKKYTLLKW